MGTGMETEQEHKGILDRDIHKSGPWLELLPRQPLERTSWSDTGSRETRWPLGTVTMRGTASMGGSLLLTAELEHPGAGHEAFIPVSPLFSMLSPGSSTSSALSRSPTSAASPLLSPRTPGRCPHPPSSASPMH